MKRYLYLPTLITTILCITLTTARAQYVAIPDTNFGNWLFRNGYDSCMTGNSISGYQIDTNCSRSFEYNATILNLSHLNISDLTGIQYISWRDNSGQNLGVDLSYNNFTRFPQPLSPWLSNIFFQVKLSYNHIDTLILDSLEAGLFELYVDHNGMNYFDIDPSFGYGHNFSLFDGSYNNLDTFPDFSYSGFLGSGTDLYLRHNKLRTAPAGYDIRGIDLGANLITTFNPRNYYFLSGLTIDSNRLTVLDLQGIGYYGMNYVDCSHNNITSIINCNFAGMANGAFICNDNNLSAIPHLPPDLVQLDCHNNPLLQCIPALPNVPAFTLNFSNTAVACLPRLYPYCQYTSTPAITSVPTCDLYNNVYGCPQYANLEGYTYIADTARHCVFDSTEQTISYLKAEFKQGGVIQQQAYSDWRGHYSFDQLAHGTYTLEVDTSFLPITVTCPDSSYYTAIVDSPNLYQSGFNFGMNCRQGYDIGVNGGSWNQFLPHQNTYVNFPAGDMSQLYGLHCASGISGQVQITYSGPVTFVSADTAGGALPPTTVSGNILTWAIADFGAVDISRAFALIFHTDSTAQLHDNICFSVAVTPVAGDNNTWNNDLYYCNEVLVAYDPNEKTVYPADNIDTSAHWLTYTIHFQNTGTGPAHNVKVTDTLDSHLDPNSFQLLNASHKNVTQLFGGTVVFNFPGINLPDSAVSRTLSTGYIQYRIKRYDNIPVGTYIYNTANIYFDFNSPVITNTTWDKLTAGCTDTTIHLAHSICAGDTFLFAGKHLTAAGTYNDTLPLAGGCDSIISLRLTVHALPVVTLTWDSLINAHKLNQWDGGTWCLWYPYIFPLAGGSPTGGHYSGENVYNDTINFYFPYGRLDTVFYTYTDSNGCIGMTLDTINTYLDCDGINEINGASSISLYPNPNSGSFTLTISDHTANSSAAGEKYIITDLPGKVIALGKISGTTQTIDLTGISPGVYVLSVSGALPVRFIVLR